MDRLRGGHSLPEMPAVMPDGSYQFNCTRQNAAYTGLDSTGRRAELRESRPLERLFRWGLSPPRPRFIACCGPK